MNHTPVTEYDSDEPPDEASALAPGEGPVEGRVEDAIDRLASVDPADAAGLAEDIAQALGTELDPPDAAPPSDAGP